VTTIAERRWRRRGQRRLVDRQAVRLPRAGRFSASGPPLLSRASTVER
jgi:hypothetical protein